MKSLSELKELRNKVQKEMKKRDQGTRAEIIVGMGTCGIAAGARDILKAVLAEVEKRDLDVRVTQTGCIGVCRLEPIFEVYMGDEKVTYVNMTADKAKEVVVNHIVNGNIVNEYTIGACEE